MYKEKKEEWLNRKCSETEQSEKSDPRLTAEQIREISGKKRATRNRVIKDRHGNILTDREEVLQRGKEYVEELYDDGRQEKPDYGLIEPGPPNLKEEVEKAVKSMKWRKDE